MLGAVLGAVVEQQEDNGLLVSPRRGQRRRGVMSGVVSDVGNEGRVRTGSQRRGIKGSREDYFWGPGHFL